MAMSKEEKSKLLSLLWKGKPKPESQKQRMSEAKKGVKKTEEHKNAMAAAGKKRSAETRVIMEELECTWREASKIRMERKGAK